jgi:hypothetical protein
MRLLLSFHANVDTNISTSFQAADGYQLILTREGVYEYSVVGISDTSLVAAGYIAVVPPSQSCPRGMTSVNRCHDGVNNVCSSMINETECAATRGCKVLSEAVCLTGYSPVCGPELDIDECVANGCQLSGACVSNCASLTKTSCQAADAACEWVDCAPTSCSGFGHQSFPSSCSQGTDVSFCNSPTVANGCHSTRNGCDIDDWRDDWVSRWDCLQGCSDATSLCLADSSCRAALKSVTSIHVDGGGCSNECWERNAPMRLDANALFWNVQTCVTGACSSACWFKSACPTLTEICSAMYSQNASSSCSAAMQCATGCALRIAMAMAPRNCSDTTHGGDLGCFELLIRLPSQLRMFRSRTT